MIGLQVGYRWREIAKKRLARSAYIEWDTGSYVGSLQSQDQCDVP